MVPIGESSRHGSVYSCVYIYTNMLVHTYGTNTRNLETCSSGVIGAKAKQKIKQVTSECSASTSGVATQRVCCSCRTQYAPMLRLSLSQTTRETYTIVLRCHQQHASVLACAARRSRRGLAQRPARQATYPQWRERDNLDLTPRLSARARH
jgi:hypothetical protein